MNAVDMFFARSKRKNLYDVFINRVYHKFGISYVDGFFDGKRFTLCYDDDNNQYWFKGCSFSDLSQDIIIKAYKEGNYVKVGETG